MGPRCTPQAECDYGKETDAGIPVGSVLVPLAGYWHSHPYSNQVLP